MQGRERDRTREIAAAAELLEVQNDVELQRFLVGLMRQAAGSRAGSRAGRALRGILTQAAGRVLPAGDRPVASGPADPAVLGLELEGLSSEDREFETARSFVRFAEAASREVAVTPKSRPAAETARAAAVRAAQRHLPGLLDGPDRHHRRVNGRAGTEPSPHEARRTVMDRYEAQEWESFEWEGPDREYESGEYEDREWESADHETQAEAEMELVNELLEVTNEQELEQFLGKLFSKAAKAVGGVIKSPVGHALGDALKGVAQNVLPLAGGALGSMVMPGVGTAIGAGLGSMAGRMFEMEFERMDEQEAEYEIASRFVKLAGSAARQAARAPRSAPPKAVARAALTTAARQHARGLLRGSEATTSRGGKGRRRPPGAQARRGGGPGYGGRPDHGGAPEPDDDRLGDEGTEENSADARSGRWVKQEDGTIVLLGV